MLTDGTIVRISEGIGFRHLSSWSTTKQETVWCEVGCDVRNTAIRSKKQMHNTDLALLLDFDEFDSLH